MADFGLYTETDSGQLTLSSDGMYYRYAGQPSLVQAASNDQGGGIFHPAIYQIDMGTNSYPPLVAVQPQTDIVTAVTNVYPYSGTIWRIEVYCQNVLSHSESMREVSPATPILHVFGPMIASGIDIGLRLWNAAQQVTFDSGWSPLKVKGYQGYSFRQGSRSFAAGGGESNMQYFNGDSMPIPVGISTPGVIGTTKGWAGSDVQAIGDSADSWGYGWRLNGSQVSRYRHFYNTPRPFQPFNWSEFNGYFYLNQTTVPMVDLSDL